MATIIDRSRLVVSVKQNPDLTQTFPQDAAEEARAYLEKLRAQGHKPTIASAENHFLVRIRQKGFDELTFYSPSLEEAKADAARIEDERRRGLFIDYRTGHRVTMAELLARFVREECPKHKGGDVEKYTLQGFIDDSHGILAAKLKERELAIDRGEKPPVVHERRTPRRGLKWLHKPFAQVLPTDIECYVHDRIEQEIAESTVDRELDLLSRICNWAIKTLRIDVHRSPMFGVRRPRYFNERDRRLRRDEEERLFAAAREEDCLRSQKLAIESRIATARAEVAALAVSRSTRKRRIAEAKAEAAAALNETYEHVPLFETLLTFLLVPTACRRGEALALTWKHTRLSEQSAFFPETKNGRSRTVPLREELIALLCTLPRTAERVFPITVDELKGAWYRICARTGIEDFHLHDWRHEGTSQIVEAFRASGVPLQVQELAAITGHRDLRMLARYTNLCAGELADRMNEAFAKASRLRKMRKGRLRPAIRISARMEAVESPPTPSSGSLGETDTARASGEAPSTDTDSKITEDPYNTLPV